MDSEQRKAIADSLITYLKPMDRPLSFGTLLEQAIGLLITSEYFERRELRLYIARNTGYLISDEFIDKCIEINKLFEYSTV